MLLSFSEGCIGILVSSFVLPPFIVLFVLAGVDSVLSFIIVVVRFCPFGLDRRDEVCRRSYVIVLCFCLMCGLFHSFSHVFIIVLFCFVRFDTVFVHVVSGFGRLIGFLVPQGVCSSSMFRLGDTVECSSSVLRWCVYGLDDFDDTGGPSA